VKRFLRTASSLCEGRFFFLESTAPAVSVGGVLPTWLGWVEVTTLSSAATLSVRSLEVFLSPLLFFGASCPPSGAVVAMLSAERFFFSLRRSKRLFSLRPRSRFFSLRRSERYFFVTERILSSLRRILLMRLMELVEEAEFALPDDLAGAETAPGAEGEVLALKMFMPDAVEAGLGSFIAMSVDSKAWFEVEVEVDVPVIFMAGKAVASVVSCLAMDSETWVEVGAEVAVSAVVMPEEAGTAEVSCAAADTGLESSAVEVVEVFAIDMFMPEGAETSAVSCMTVAAGVVTRGGAGLEVVIMEMIMPGAAKASVLSWTAVDAEAGAWAGAGPGARFSVPAGGILMLLTFWTSPRTVDGWSLGRKGWI
jgi:hypothetical protein